MTIASFILAYAVCGLLLVGLCALHNDRLTAQYHERLSSDRVFKCSGCGFVYTDDPDVTRSQCPQCRQFNFSIEF